MTNQHPQTISDLYPDPWLRPDDLNGGSFILTIRTVTIEKLHNPRTNEKEKKAVLDFGRSKRLPLNKTQCLAIAAIAQSECFAEWRDTRLTLATGRASNGKPTIIITPAPPPETKAEAEPTAVINSSDEE